MHPWRASIAALLIMITTPARAQLDDSYTPIEGTSPAPSSSGAPTAKRPPPAPERPLHSADVYEGLRIGLFVTGGIVAGGGVALIGLSAATSGSDPEGAGIGALLGSGVAGTGLLLFGVGSMIRPKRVLVRDAAVTVAPVIAKDTFGGAFAVSF